MTQSSEWLAQRDPRCLGKDDMAELRELLLRDLEDMTGSRAADVQDEVNKFIASGRFTESNLARLQRRVRIRLGSKTARMGSRRSLGNPGDVVLQGGAETAREWPSNVGHRDRRRQGQKTVEQVEGTAPAPKSIAFATAPDISHEQSSKQTSADDQSLRWSELGKLKEKEAEADQRRKKEARQNAQREMRDVLKKQMELKEAQKRREAEQEQQLNKLQEEELARWRHDQDTKHRNAIHKIKQIEIERHSQSEDTFKIREAEREMKLDEDRRIVLRAERELEQERRAQQEKKQRMKQACRTLAEQQQKSPRCLQAEERQQRIQEEKKLTQQYDELMQVRQEREKLTAPRIREQPKTGPPQSKRRGEEIYYEEDVVMRIYHEAVAKAEEAERSKQDRLRAARSNNQDYLFSQIAERDMRKKNAFDQKSTLKAAAEAATTDFRELESRKASEKRSKYIDYRHELEKQMEEKKNKHLLADDEMNPIEKAINRRFVLDSRAKTGG